MLLTECDRDNIVYAGRKVSSVAATQTKTMTIRNLQCTGHADVVCCKKIEIRFDFQVGRQAGLLLLFVGCLSSQQQASVSQGRICSDKCTCCTLR